MISRNITRRLERLEHATMPAGIRKVWQIVILDSDGSRRDGPTIEWPSTGPSEPLLERFRSQSR
jgi:hypothetical protein